MPCGHSPPTACRHAVSGTISLPSQGFFSPFPHGTSSLSVASEYLALPDGPGGFPQGSTCPAVLRSHLKYDCIFTYGAVTLYGRTFQTVPLTLSYASFTSGRQSVLPTPHHQDLWSCNPRLSFRIAWFRLFRVRSPLLAESRLFSLPPGTEMVHFPGFASYGYVFTHDTWCSHQVGSPIRKSPDHRLFASPRGFSQLATSFIAFLRLGIPTHALSSLTIKSISNTDSGLAAL